MKKHFLVIVFVSLSLSIIAQSYHNVPIGGWREHLSYYRAHALVSVGDRILVASESALFYVDKKTGETERFSKVAGLSDAGIKLLAYDPETKTTIITYTNSNIDIVQKGNVYNISDIRLRSIEGSKEINQIIFNNKKAYLACGFGIVVLDLTRHEIFDTYYIGTNSSAIKVSQMAINDTAIFAATDKQGLLYAPKNNTNALASSDTWQMISAIDTAHGVKIDKIFTLNSGNLICALTIPSTTNHNVVKYNGTTLDTILADEYFTDISASQDKIVEIGYKAIIVYDSNFTQLSYYDESWNPLYRYNGKILTMIIQQAIVDGNELFMAHEHIGLIRVNNYLNAVHQAVEYCPNGPSMIDVYSIKATKEGVIYAAPGSKNMQNVPMFVPSTIYTFEDNEWHHLIDVDGQDTIHDILDVAIFN
jgi:hypothetical protein